VVHREVLAVASWNDLRGVHRVPGTVGGLIPAAIGLGDVSIIPRSSHGGPSDGGAKGAIETTRASGSNHLITSGKAIAPSSVKEISGLCHSVSGSGQQNLGFGPASTVLTE